MLLILSAGSFSFYAQESLHRYSAGIMGTEFNILLYGEEDTSEKFASLAFEEIRRINNIFSLYIDNSELSIVNQKHKWQVISQEMADLIRFSESMNTSSKGAFDIKIGRAINLWKQAILDKVLPDQKQLKKLKKKRLVIRSKVKNGLPKIRLSRSTQLDFGGVAKGYAVDMAFQLLQSKGISICLIDGGGDIRMGNSPPGTKGWKIQVLSGKSKMLYLKNTSIATSGNQYQFLQIANVRFSHIIDPRTLIAQNLEIGVTIISKSCMAADALATALSVSPYLSNHINNIEFKSLIKIGDEYIVKEF